MNCVVYVALTETDKGVTLIDTRVGVGVGVGEGVGSGVGVGVSMVIVCL